MPSRVVVSGVILVVIVALLAFTVEFFLPLSAKTDMNMLCRRAMLRMEVEGGMSEEIENDLISGLMEKGFDGINIDGTDMAKQGEDIRLVVEADYIYSKLTGLFTRTDMRQRMVYGKTSVARKVVN
mgnify:CR=1 FL=1